MPLQIWSFYPESLKTTLSRTLDLINYILMNFRGLRDSDQLCSLSLLFNYFAVKEIRISNELGLFKLSMFNVQGTSGDGVKTLTIECNMG